MQLRPVEFPALIPQNDLQTVPARSVQTCPDPMEGHVDGPAAAPGIRVPDDVREGFVEGEHHRPSLRGRESQPFGEDGHSAAHEAEALRVASELHSQEQIAPAHGGYSTRTVPGTRGASSPNPAYVTFSQRYQTENTFDGGVLEISINGGPFTDILAAGGSFITGGYTGTISPFDGSPIAGRPSWTGLSAGWPGYQVSTASFPPSAFNQSIRLRWRFVPDFIVPSVGQWIDSVGIVDDYPAMTCTGYPSALPQEVGTILAQPDKITYTFPLAAGAGDYDAMRGLTPFLPVGPGGGDEACALFLGGTFFTDGSAPPVSTANWYLARGRNECGLGTWGTQSNGTPRVSTTCP